MDQIHFFVVFRDIGGQEADGKEGSPTKQILIWGTKPRPTYLHSSGPSSWYSRVNGKNRKTSFIFYGISVDTSFTSNIYASPLVYRERYTVFLVANLFPALVGVIYTYHSKGIYIPKFIPSFCSYYNLQTNSGTLFLS